VNRTERTENILWRKREDLFLFPSRTALETIVSTNEIILKSSRV